MWKQLNSDGDDVGKWQRNANELAVESCFFGRRGDVRLRI
jgi:hypothetical protein